MPDRKSSHGRPQGKEIGSRLLAISMGSPSPPGGKSRRRREAPPREKTQNLLDNGPRRTVHGSKPQSRVTGGSGSKKDDDRNRNRSLRMDQMNSGSHHSMYCIH